MTHIPETDPVGCAYAVISISVLVVSIVHWCWPLLKEM